jgi:hypothetical protein
VTGTVAFDEPQSTNRRYQLRRDACGTTSAANPRLSVFGGGESIGCGGLTSAATPIDVTYPAVDGLPLRVDASRSARLTLTQGAWVAGVGGGFGQETVAATLQGVVDGEVVTLGTGTASTVVTPADDKVTTVVDIPLTGVTSDDVVTALSLVTRVSGTVGRSYVAYGGASFLDLPLTDIGRVDVTIGSYGASAVGAVVEPDGTWRAEVPMPTPGTRTVNARAVQNGVTVRAEPVTITVTP